eukprot:TRINITY_DN8243_c0_g1_i1.p1 TRINITY_DN8243_c0_g1~~TRINITY_DN8243_c0_g1_i1.p1  ORF type:complete len:490 (+),score=177.45 TRINITY_DN8243_c0_g1_i1:16-1485(+)
MEQEADESTLLNDLPLEALLKILSFLDTREKMILRRVCQTFWEALEHPSLWNELDMFSVRTKLTDERLDFINESFLDNPELGKVGLLHCSFRNCLKLTGDKIVEFVNAHPEITSLDISNTDLVEFGKHHFQSIVENHRLRRLAFAGANPDWKKLDFSSKEGFFSDLEFLDISTKTLMFPTTDSDLELILPSMPKLKSLVLVKSEVTNVTSIAKFCRNLEHLDISQAVSTDPIILFDLKDCESLTSLNISGASIDGDSLLDISKVVPLRKLMMKGVGVKLASKDFDPLLENLSGLQELNANECSGLSNKACLAAVKHLKHPSKLFLNVNMLGSLTKFDGDLVDSLQQWKTHRLTELHLKNWKLEEEEWCALATNLPFMMKIDVSGSNAANTSFIADLGATTKYLVVAKFGTEKKNHTNDEHLAVLCMNNPMLRVLDIRNLRNVSDASAFTLGEFNKKLEELNVYGIDLSNSAMNYMYSQCPHLQSSNVIK